MYKQELLEIDRRTNAVSSLKTNEKGVVLPDPLKPNDNEREIIRHMSFVDSHEKYVLLQIATPSLPPYSKIPNIRIVGSAPSLDAIKSIQNKIINEDPNQQKITFLVIEYMNWHIIPSNKDHYLDPKYCSSKAKRVVDHYLEKYDKEYNDLVERLSYLKKDEQQKDEQKDEQKDKQKDEQQKNEVKDSFPLKIKTQTKKYYSMCIIKDEESNPSEREDIIIVLQGFNRKKECIAYNKFIAGPRTEKFDLYCVKSHEWGNYEQLEIYPIQESYRQKELGHVLDCIKNEDQP